MTTPEEKKTADYKVRLTVAYEGTDFGGWQKQPTQKPTVQGEIEKALSQLFSEPVKTFGSGRTDAGVHAVAQEVHFFTNKDPKVRNIRKALNSLTPESIVIKKCYEVPEDFHVMFSAQRKTYKYLIQNTPTPSAFRRNFTNWISRPIDVEYLNQVSKIIEGKQDFKSFQTAGTDVATTVREIFEARWSRPSPELIEFTVTGSGFLKQMVRNLVGHLLYMERNKLPKNDLIDVIAQKDRRAAKDCAPARGLYLYCVKYPRELDNRCREI